MRDEDYIRTTMRQERYIDFDELNDSHDVADDVMRELAEALRACAAIEVGTRTKKRAALARYYALTKETNDD